MPLKRFRTSPQSTARRGLFPGRRRPRLRPGGRGLHAWETLGHGGTGLEPLEARMLMAADLAVTLDDNIIVGVVRSYYQPGSQITYTLKVTNSGDADATAARLTTSLAGAITQEIGRAHV